MMYEFVCKYENCRRKFNSRRKNRVYCSIFCRAKDTGHIGGSAVQEKLRKNNLGIYNQNTRHIGTMNSVIRNKQLGAGVYNYEKQLSMQKLARVALQKRPTSFESKIILLIQQNKLPFRYVGNGKFFIGFKNPDFVDCKNKKVIEVFYSYFKIRDYQSVNRYKSVMKKHYHKYGYTVIFIDETQIKNNNWEQLCLSKIK